MRLPRLLSGLVFVALILSSTSRAGIIYSDGGTHIANSVSPNIMVLDGSTLNVLPGAAITGTTGTGPGDSDVAVLVTGSNSTVNVSGGTLTGASVGDALLVNNFGNAIVTGGVFQAGSNAAAVEAAGNLLTIQGGTFEGPVSSDGRTTSISGGTFEAGGVFSTGDSGSTTVITGGTFVNNSITFSPNSGFGENATLTIGGGLFQVPSINLDFFAKGEFTVLGTGLNFDGNNLTGTLADGNTINVPLEIFAVPIVDGQRAFLTITQIPGGLEFLYVVTPEPPSLVMGTTAVVIGLGLALASRMRRTSHA